MIRRTYDGIWIQCRSTKINVSKRVASEARVEQQTQEPGAHQAPPLINNGVHVHQHAEQSGGRLRRVKRARCCGATSGSGTARALRRAPRRTAASRSTVTRSTYGAGEAVVVALDAKTGKEVWAKQVYDNSVRYYITLAPLAADGKILVGASGGEFGVRGYVSPRSTGNGNELWRTYTIPAPGDPGSETWPKGRPVEKRWGLASGSRAITTPTAYRLLGARATAALDGRSASRRQPVYRVDDRLNASTGKIVGHFSVHPNESFDWDEVSPPAADRFPTSMVKPCEVHDSTHRVPAICGFSSARRMARYGSSRESRT
jgi:alcohol dehydrogenase (cytochrome c)